MNCQSRCEKYVDLDGNIGLLSYAVVECNALRVVRFLVDMDHESNSYAHYIRTVTFHRYSSVLLFVRKE